jgi:hypothetical protein
MRGHALLVVALALGAGCSTVETQGTTVAVPADPTVGIEVASSGNMVLRAGVFTVPVRVTNNRDRFVQVFFDRSELEETNGRRRHRRVTGPTSCTIAPGRSETFRLVFGGPRAPVYGDHFRVWLWVAPTDGSGVIEGVPPLVFGVGTFTEPPRSFTKSSPAAGTLPLPTEPPPPEPEDPAPAAVEPARRGS